METTMNENESLEVIRKMINQGKVNFKEQSIFYLIWGWAAFSAGIIEYVLLQLEYAYHPITWAICMTIGGIASGIVGAKQGKKRKFVTFTDGAMKYLWIGFIVYLFIVLFMSTSIGWAASYVLIVGLYGLGTFVSGGILQFKPLIIGGISSLVLALAGGLFSSVFDSFSNALLLLCLSLLVSYLIPGYMLRSKNFTNAA